MSEKNLVGSLIVGEIRRYLRDNSTLRVSRSMRDTAYRVLQARERLLRQQQREPTMEQIAQELEMPREEVVFAMDAMSAPVSLFDPVVLIRFTPSVQFKGLYLCHNQASISCSSSFSGSSVASLLNSASSSAIRRRSKSSTERPFRRSTRSVLKSFRWGTWTAH